MKTTETGSRYSSMPQAAGFTLTELLLALVILTAPTACALPAILTWQKRFPLEQSVSLLQWQIQETRFAAASSGQIWYLTLPHGGMPGERTPAAAHSAATTARSPLQTSVRPEKLGNAVISDSRFQWPAGISCQLIGNDSATTHPGQSVPIQIQVHPEGTVVPVTIRLFSDSGQSRLISVDRLTGNTTLLTAVASKDSSWGICASVICQLQQPICGHFRSVVQKNTDAFVASHEGVRS
ncbi:MAG: Tfp pilus assembly protein FimT/FimU [Planctomyces sp.]